MKIVSLNIEGKKHLDRVLPFIHSQQADVVCLMEAPETIQEDLRSLGYHSAFAPMLIRTFGADTFLEGVLLAAKHPFVHETLYYHRPQTAIVPYDSEHKRSTIAHPVISATIAGSTVATTHFTWTPDGLADAHQETDLQSLMTHLATLPPHVLCGDFNIPRGHNTLYASLAAAYTDAIPTHFHSSLDATLHRLGALPDKQLLFKEYMVDYLFTQPPYVAHTVELVFGLSDHAAVVGEVRTAP